MFILLVHWHNIPRIDMLTHSDKLSWFRANQSLLFLLTAACLINTNFIVFGLTLTEFEPSIYHTRGKHANHYITNANNDLRNTTQKPKDRATWSPLNFELFNFDKMFISNVCPFSLILLQVIVSINLRTLILKMMGQCDVKHTQCYW